MPWDLPGYERETQTYRYCPGVARHEIRPGSTYECYNRFNCYTRMDERCSILYIKAGRCHDCREVRKRRREAANINGAGQTRPPPLLQPSLLPPGTERVVLPDKTQEECPVDKWMRMDDFPLPPWPQPTTVVSLVLPPSRTPVIINHRCGGWRVRHGSRDR